MVEKAFEEKSERIKKKVLEKCGEKTRWRSRVEESSVEHGVERWQRSVSENRDRDM